MRKQSIPTFTVKNKSKATTKSAKLNKNKNTIARAHAQCAQ